MQRYGTCVNCISRDTHQKENYDDSIHQYSIFFPYRLLSFSHNISVLVEIIWQFVNILFIFKRRFKRVYKTSFFFYLFNFCFVFDFFTFSRGFSLVEMHILLLILL